jgi:hypothetical protein
MEHGNIFNFNADFSLPVGKFTDKTLQTIIKLNYRCFFTLQFKVSFV